MSFRVNVAVVDIACDGHVLSSHLINKKKMNAKQQHT